MKLKHFLFILSMALLFSCKKEGKPSINEVIPIKESKKTEIKKKKKQQKKVILDSLNNKNAVTYFTEYGKQNKETLVRFKTRLGNIDIKLYNNTPLHRANFIFLTKKEYFNTTCFHRVVPNFIIQGGDSENQTTVNFRNKYKHYLLPPEFRKNRKHKRGVIAIARDWEYNPEKLSTPFEFYIVLNKRGEHHLDNEHTVFGEIINGMSVVDKISKLRTGSDEWPFDDVFITATILD